MVDVTNWFLAGLTLPQLYENNFTKQQKRNWKQNFSIHHGEAGVIVGVLGLLMYLSSNHPDDQKLGKQLTALGAGLAIDDWADRHLWFR